MSVCLRPNWIRQNIHHDGNASEEDIGKKYITHLSDRTNHIRAKLFFFIPVFRIPSA